MEYNRPYTLLGSSLDPPLATNAQVIVLGKSNPGQGDFQLLMPDPVDKKALYTVVIVSQRPTYSSDVIIPTVQALYCHALHFVGENEGLHIRFACEAGFMGALLGQRKFIEFDLGDEGSRERLEVFRNKVKVVALAGIMNEDWVEALRGEDPCRWV